MTRDRTWADMYIVAERMTAKYGRQVKAHTRRRGVWRVQGLATGGLTFEPVRQRRMFSRDWVELQSVAEAARRMGGLLRGADDPCPECGHPVWYHPGRIPVAACALCVADEDRDKITEAEMCRREFAPTSETP
jgi:hypothetical protein